MRWVAVRATTAAQTRAIWGAQNGSSSQRVWTTIVSVASARPPRNDSERQQRRPVDVVGEQDQQERPQRPAGADDHPDHRGAVDGEVGGDVEEPAHGAEARLDSA